MSQLDKGSNSMHVHQSLCNSTKIICTVSYDMWTTEGKWEVSESPGTAYIYFWMYTTYFNFYHIKREKFCHPNSIHIILVTPWTM